MRFTQIQVLHHLRANRTLPTMLSMNYTIELILGMIRIFSVKLRSQLNFTYSTLQVLRNGDANLLFNYMVEVLCFRLLEFSPVLSHGKSIALRTS